MKLSDCFDRTYVLNLPERADRRREIGEVLSAAGMAFEPGKLELFNAKRPDAPGEFPSIGARGCFLSHLGMLAKAKDLRLSRLLIMEDDLDLSPRVQEILSPLSERLGRDDWGMAYLGHVLKPETPPDAPFSLAEFVGPIATTHFYAVHEQVLNRLTTFLEEVLNRPAGHPEGGAMHVDGAFTTFRARNPDVVTLVARPNLGWQRSSSSDITSQWYDRSALTRGLISAARIVRRRLSPPPR